MIWIDYVIIVLIGLSTLIGVVRGFMKEFISLSAWIAALWISLRFSPAVAESVFSSISLPSVRLALAFLLLFIGIVIIGGLIAHVFVTLVKRTHLQSTDRGLGLLFGAIRGIVLVLLLVVLGRMSPVVQDPWWQESFLIGKFEELAQWTTDQLPDDIASQFRQLETDLLSATTADSRTS